MERRSVVVMGAVPLNGDRDVLVAGLAACVPVIQQYPRPSAPVTRCARVWTLHRRALDPAARRAIQFAPWGRHRAVVRGVRLRPATPSPTRMRLVVHLCRLDHTAGRGT